MGEQNYFILGMLTALALLHLVTSQIVIHPGGTFKKTCPQPGASHPEDNVAQVFRDRFESKMFGSVSSVNQLTVISNDSDIIPQITNQTDRYSITKHNDHLYEFEIKNVIDSDSAWYGCRTINRLTGFVVAETVSQELLVPGPLEDSFWSSNISLLALNDVDDRDSYKYKIANGKQVLIDNEWFGPELACVVVVSNVEPLVNITIGKPGEPGSVDITNQMNIRSTAKVTFEVGIQILHTLYFSKSRAFTRTSLKDLYCTASLYDVKFESHIDVQLRSKPPISKNCDPFDFTAMLGDKNVKLTCLVPAHPYADINWLIEGHIKVNVSSPWAGYSVTNKKQFDGVLTILTIQEVTRFYPSYNPLKIQAVNSEGSGEMYLSLSEGRQESRTSIGSRSVSEGGSPSFLIMFGFLLWMIQRHN